ncbi:MAG TPA: phage holin family protein, partial [Thermoanaerobaculia bacterium]|nr:phage holin family protein [Thermoanaerobaculia bacterium]
MSTITEPRFAEQRAESTKSGASLGQLLRDLVQDLRDLTRGEMDLLKAEVRERFGRLEKALMLFAVGGAVALAAALTLLYALNMGLTALFTLFLPTAVAVWLAPLVLAILFGVVGAIVLSRGSAVMRDTDWQPTQTRQTLREDKQWLQNKI